MKTSELVSAVILKATGKIYNGAEGDKKWNKVVGIANKLISDWSDELGIDWSSLYEPLEEIDTISTDKEYALPSKVKKVSDDPDDYLYVLHTDGKTKTKYATVRHTKLKLHEGQNVCAVLGNRIVFPTEFTSDNPVFGGTLYAPVYYHPSLLTDADSNIVVDIPSWLVVRCAAEYVRNDIILQNQYPNLVSEANQLMGKMIENEGAQDDDIFSFSMGSMRNW